VLDLTRWKQVLDLVGVVLHLEVRASPLRHGSNPVAGCDAGLRRVGSSVT
jgi:hypothetical protein